MDAGEFTLWGLVGQHSFIVGFGDRDGPLFYSFERFFGGAGVMWCVFAGCADNGGSFCMGGFINLPRVLSITIGVIPGGDREVHISSMVFVFSALVPCYCGVRWQGRGRTAVALLSLRGQLVWGSNSCL